MVCVDVRDGVGGKWTCGECGGRTDWSVADIGAEESGERRALRIGRVAMYMNGLTMIDQQESAKKPPRLCRTTTSGSYPQVRGVGDERRQTVWFQSMYQSKMSPRSDITTHHIYI